MWWLIAAAAVGAATGIISTYQEKERQKSELERRKTYNENAYNYGKANSDRQYELQKSEALWQLGMQDSALREGMGQFTDEYNTHLLARAYEEQDARIQTASGIGASLVQEGMSGTRGNAANQMMRDYANERLERQIEVQRKQDENALAGTVANANRSISAMAHERASWEEGGYRYEAKLANDEYNKNMYDLGQSEYQWHINDITQASWDNFLDYFTAFNAGASSGAAQGNAWSQYSKSWWEK